MMFGLDLLGLARYPNVKLPAGFALGVFANTFGDPLPAVEKIVKRGTCPLVRVHLLWADNHVFGRADLRKMRTEAKRVEDLAKLYKNVRFEVSPFCEHNLENPLPYLQECAKIAPSCTIVNTPWRGAVVRKYKNEVHGLHTLPSGPYNFSYDGLSAVDADVKTFKTVTAAADVHFFWVSQFNGRMTTKDVTPRPDRRAWPSQDLIDSVAFLGTDSKSPRILNTALWKSHAEQHNVPYSPRELNPVLITPTKGASAVLVTTKGRKEVAKMPRYPEQFADGRYRYYLGEYGYKIALKALEISGSPMCDIWIEGTRIGRVNPGFRAGVFRD